MKFRAPAFLLTLALTVPLAFMAYADQATPSQTQTLAPTADQATATRLVYGLLSDSRFAYRPKPMNAELADDIFKRYLEALDGSKQYFTQADIDSFAPYKAQMADAIRNGDLAPAYAIFEVYKQRLGDRVAFARQQLNQDFDFTGHERWEYDRKEAPWAADIGELNALWHKSVMNDWLRLKLAGKAPADIRATLDKRYTNLTI